MEQLCSHWSDFHEILYSIIFQKKPFEKIKISDLSTGVHSKNEDDVTTNILDETIIDY